MKIVRMVESWLFLFIFLITLLQLGVLISHLILTIEGISPGNVIHILGSVSIEYLLPMPVAAILVVAIFGFGVRPTLLAYLAVGALYFFPFLFLIGFMSGGFLLLPFSVKNTGDILHAVFALGIVIPCFLIAGSHVFRISSLLTRRSTKDPDEA